MYFHAEKGRGTINKHYIVMTQVPSLVISNKSFTFFFVTYEGKCQYNMLLTVEKRACLTSVVGLCKSDLKTMSVNFFPPIPPKSR